MFQEYIVPANERYTLENGEVVTKFQGYRVTMVGGNNGFEDLFVMVFTELNTYRCDVYPFITVAEFLTIYKIKAEHI